MNLSPSVPLAPIALFVYNRPWHTQQTVEALKRNHLSADSELHIFSDGAQNPSAQDDVNAVRQYIKTITGFRSVKVYLRPLNLGLAGNITVGVTDVINAKGHIIVLEDDLVTSPHFLSYMNNALDLYKEQMEVISIHGYIYPIPSELPETFFIRGADCWGWATWKRGWDQFSMDGQELLRKLTETKQLDVFDFNRSYPYSKMLRDMIAGKNDSWAVRWYASAFLANKLTLYPGRSLVFNIGTDGTGTHGDGTRVFDTLLDNQPVAVQSINVVENQEAKARMIDFYRYGRKTGIVTKLLKAAKKLFSR